MDRKNRILIVGSAIAAGLLFLPQLVRAGNPIGNGSAQPKESDKFQLSDYKFSGVRLSGTRLKGDVIFKISNFSIVPLPITGVNLGLNFNTNEIGRLTSQSTVLIPRNSTKTVKLSADINILSIAGEIIEQVQNGITLKSILANTLSVKGNVFSGPFAQVVNSNIKVL